MKMVKPDFKDINFDSDLVCWGVGNNIVGPRLIGRYKIRDLTEEEKDIELKKYNEAKEIYEKFINKGQKFKPAGQGAREDSIAKITFIHSEKQTITWKQINAPEGLKPASGRWTINGILALVRQEKIIFI